MILYTIGSSKPAAHYFDVTIDIEQPDPQGQLLRLPAWIPGSYMIRDFAKNIIDIRADGAGEKPGLQQLDKSTWQLERCDAPVRISYRVYAWDLSVRGAHLDTTHGFFNGTSVFFEVVGQSDQVCQIRINKPEHEACADWRLATTMPRSARSESQGDFTFGLFEAENYRALIDYPVEMGEFTQLDFRVGGIRHDVILTGKFQCDEQRLKSDLTKICEQHIDMFGRPAPMKRYMFLVMVVGSGYGGLEHRDSTSLLCSRADLPLPGQLEMSDQYREFLGLCSHEYFHSWNVKRIKPDVYENPDLSTEVYTPLLWAFEGITSYYDDLALVRSGCITPEGYLELLARTITRVLRNQGRKRQSVAESSFNAWTKFYKQDENASNAIVSYYAKGSLVALCIDLKIRQLTGHKKSLDDVMRTLWSRFQEGLPGVEEQAIQQIISELVEQDLGAFLDTLIYQTEELPLQELLQSVSVKMNLRASAGAPDKGGKAEKNLPQSYLGAQLVEAETGLKVQVVTEDSPAQAAGLSAQDVIIAINELKADTAYFNSWLRCNTPGTMHRITAFRRDELMTFEVVLGQPPEDTAVLEVGDADDALLKKWLLPEDSC